MTTKEKAKELFDKYQIAGSQWYVDRTKKYALIAVDEILNNFGSTADGKHFFTAYSTLEYWQEVKKEINNL